MFNPLDYSKCRAEGTVNDSVQHRYLQLMGSAGFANFLQSVATLPMLDQHFMFFKIGFEKMLQRVIIRNKKIRKRVKFKPPAGVITYNSAIYQ